MTHLRWLVAAACLVLAPAALSLPLWELEGARGQVRLLGSIHFLRASDYPLPPAMQRAYDEADVLVMELDMDDLDQLQAQATIMQMAMDPKGRNLETLIGPRDYAKARRDAEAINLQLDMFQPFEPWFASLQITQLRLMQLGFDPNLGLEQQWSVRARADGKEVRGLETLQDQLGALDSMPEQVQKKFFLMTIEEAVRAESMIDRTLSAWRNGDLDELGRETTQALREQPQVYQKLLVDRNRAWTRQIKELARDDGNYLVIVGSAHLLGEDSVLQMLERDGYKSTRITR
ncbi:MAG: TraB/GumN family protein [Chromatiales bacterium]|nr:MAG: TraB/GumN family protein [Chromatiales bacterium]